MICVQKPKKYRSIHVRVNAWPSLLNWLYVYIVSVKILGFWTQMAKNPVIIRKTACPNCKKQRVQKSKMDTKCWTRMYQCIPAELIEMSVWSGPEQHSLCIEGGIAWQRRF